VADLGILGTKVPRKESIAVTETTIAAIKSTDKVFVCVLWNLKDKRGYVFTTKNLTNRWETISSQLGSGKFHNRELIADWIRYGKKGFKLRIIAKEDTRTEAQQIAHALIVALGAKAYNPTRSWMDAVRKKQRARVVEENVESHLTVGQLKEIKRRALNGVPASEIAADFQVRETSVTFIATCWELDWL
jgi:hypothetical protein